MAKLALKKEYKPYKEYKDSGVEWIGKVPASWSTTPIKSLFTRVKRTGFSEEKLLSVYRDYGVIEKSSRDDNHNKPSNNLSPYQLVQKDDLVTNKMKAWQGSIAISQLQGIVSPAYHVYKPLKKNSSRYLHYLLRSDRYIAHYVNISTGIRNNQWDLDPMQFKNMNLLVPKVEEQEKIADFLDEKITLIDSIIEKKKKLIELLKEKRSAVISSVVTGNGDLSIKFDNGKINSSDHIPDGWNNKKLGHICKIQASNIDKHIKENEGVLKVCNYVDVYKNEYITNELTTKFLKASASEQQVKKFLLEDGDILLTKDSETPEDIGVPAFVSIDKGVYVCGYHIYQLKKVDNEIEPEFLFRFLQSYLSKAWFETRSKGITRFGLSSLEVLFPDVAEQRKIVQSIQNKTELYDNALDACLKSIPYLQEYKSSLISHAVTGKIKI